MAEKKRSESEPDVEREKRSVEMRIDTEFWGSDPLDPNRYDEKNNPIYEDNEGWVIAFAVPTGKEEKIVAPNGHEDTQVEYRLFKIRRLPGVDYDLHTGARGQFAYWLRPYRDYLEKGKW